MRALNKEATNLNKEMTTMNKTPTIRLSNGVELSLLGLSVYLSSPKDTADAVQSAVASGYRLIDTAAAYGNEREVGEGIARGAVPRDELFVTTKLWISDYGYDAALRALDVNVNKTGSASSRWRRSPTRAVPE